MIGIFFINSLHPWGKEGVSKGGVYRIIIVFDEGYVYMCMYFVPFIIVLHKVHFSGL